MEKISAATGWTWVTQGFALFWRQPAEMLTLFMAYLFLIFALSMIPLIGDVLPMMMLPILSIGFMQACAHIEIGRRVYPNVLVTGFRSGARSTLLKLCCLYLLTVMAVIAVSLLVDDGTLSKVLTGQLQLNEKTMQESNIMQVLLLSIALYLPPAMAFWYAAALVQWQKMGIGKAIFYSFFAVWRARAAFLVYGIAWLVLGLILPGIAKLLIQSLTADPMLAAVLLLPVSIFLTVSLYCSFYATYTTIFGAIPEVGAPAEPDAAP